VVECLPSKHNFLSSKPCTVKKKLFNVIIYDSLYSKINGSWCQWLMPIILATQEAEIRRIKAQDQPRQIVCETLFEKNPSQERCGGVV
jgi:hypothetical protein